MQYVLVFTVWAIGVNQQITPVHMMIDFKNKELCDAAGKELAKSYVARGWQVVWACLEKGKLE